MVGLLALASGIGMLFASAPLPARAQAPPGTEGCPLAYVNATAARWVRVKKRRRVHGRLRVVRRNGHVVYVRIRVHYTTRTLEHVCPPPGQPQALAPLALTEPSSSSALAPTSPVPVPSPAVEAPRDVTAPAVIGAPISGQTLLASPGTWSNAPTGYAYEWQRCSAAGVGCSPISGAASSAYALAPSDVGATIRVAVSASNFAGAAPAAYSPPTSVVLAAGSVQHLEYVFVDGLISVYDMDHEQRLVKTISLPQTDEGVRGVTVAPSTHLLFISYGGDGTSFHGSVLAYDLVREKVAWTVHLNSGIDSGQVSPDGKLLYMPTGENTASGIWNVLSTADGSVVGTIAGGAGAHNTIASNDGRFVYLGGRNYNYLDVYETSSGQVRKIGPLQEGVRPFTVNGANTLAFTTATGFDGFQVSSVTSGHVLFTVSFGAVPSGFPFTGPSHGISLSPDEKQLYVIDSVHKEVRVFNVSEVSKSVAPIELGAIPVAGLSGEETPCAYDCGRGGWLQHSLDGRLVYVGDSGEVIETATRRVVATLGPLLNTKKTLEVDWSGGVPIAASGRSGVGRVG